MGIDGRAEPPNLSKMEDHLRDVQSRVRTTKCIVGGTPHMLPTGDVLKDYEEQLRLLELGDERYYCCNGDELRSAPARSVVENFDRDLFLREPIQSLGLDGDVLESFDFNKFLCGTSDDSGFSFVTKSLERDAKEQAGQVTRAYLDCDRIGHLPPFAPIEPAPSTYAEQLRALHVLNRIVHRSICRSTPPKVPEAFDIDSFLSKRGNSTNSNDEVQNSFDFDAFLQGTINPDGWEYFKDPLHQETRAQAAKASVAYLRAIVDIHRAYKGCGERVYPDELQNLLLTASRVFGAIYAHLNFLSHTLHQAQGEPLEMLTRDLQAALELYNEIRSATRWSASSSTNKFGTIKQYERRIYMILSPLMVYYKHIKQSCESDNRELQNLEYEGFPRELDDSSTMIEDSKSIASEDTLLGFESAKEKYLDSASSDAPFDQACEMRDVRFRSYLCGLIRIPERAPQSALVEMTIEAQGKHTAIKRLVATIEPSYLKQRRRERHAQKLSTAVETIKQAAEAGNLDDRAIWNWPLIYEAITQKCLLESFARFGNLHAVKWMLARGASPCGLAKNITRGLIPLVHAIHSATPDVCEALIVAGARKHIDVLGGLYERGDGPLAAAVMEQKTEVVKVLLKHGAFDHEVRRLHEDGGEDLQTSLHRAAADTKLYAELGVLLEDRRVAKHIDLCAGSKLNTPLHHAAGANNVSAIKMLLDAGASIEARNLRLCSPLHWAIKHGHVEAAEYLIQHGADVNAARLRLEPPLKSATSNGSLKLLQLLLKHGAKINGCTSEGKTALHAAAAHEKSSLVQALLDAGADANARSANGSTPLFLAAQNGRIANVKLLLERGANPALGRTPYKSSTTRDPKYIAKRGGNLEVVRLLECWERGEDFGPVHEDQVELSAEDQSCSWEYWFEKYIVKIYETDLGNDA